MKLSCLVLIIGRRPRSVYVVWVWKERKLWCIKLLIAVRSIARQIHSCPIVNVYLFEYFFSMNFSLIGEKNSATGKFRRNLMLQSDTFFEGDLDISIIPTYRNLRNCLFTIIFYSDEKFPKNSKKYLYCTSLQQHRFQLNCVAKSPISRKRNGISENPWNVIECRIVDSLFQINC